MTRGLTPNARISEALIDALGELREGANLAQLVVGDLDFEVLLEFAQQRQHLHAVDAQTFEHVRFGGKLSRVFREAARTQVDQT
jgi:hypothetical protein